MVVRFCDKDVVVPEDEDLFDHRLFAVEAVADDDERRASGGTFCIFARSLFPALISQSCFSFPSVFLTSSGAKGMTCLMPGFMRAAWTIWWEKRIVFFSACETSGTMNLLGAEVLASHR